MINHCLSCNPYGQSYYEIGAPFVGMNNERQMGSPFGSIFGQILGPGGFFGPPSSPPFGIPGGPTQGPPNIPPFGGGSQQGDVPPTTPPPTFVPMQTEQIGTFAVDPGGIRRCLFRFTYVWLNNRQQFWYYPTFVGRTSVAGWRWTGFRWVFFGIDLRQIQSFTCV